MSSKGKTTKRIKVPKNAVSRGSGKVKKYFNFRREFPGYTKQACKELAGYSKTTNPDEIENTKLFKALWAEHEALCASLDLDIETRIRNAQKATGASVQNNLKVLQDIINKKATKDRDKVSAIKQSTDTTGERMPTEANVSLTTDEELLSKILNVGTT